MNKTIRFIAHGRVQGVGFRAFTQREAARHGLSGWVRNRFDGAVEGLCEGPAAQVDAFLAELERGPSLGRVTQLEIEPAEPEHHTTFEVRF